MPVTLESHGIRNLDFFYSIFSHSYLSSLFQKERAGERGGEGKREEGRERNSKGTSPSCNERTLDSIQRNKEQR